MSPEETDAPHSGTPSESVLIILPLEPPAKYPKSETCITEVI